VDDDEEKRSSSSVHVKGIEEEVADRDATLHPQN
jgi:hypothetical protein